MVPSDQSILMAHLAHLDRKDLCLLWDQKVQLDRWHPPHQKDQKDPRDPSVRLDRSDQMVQMVPKVRRDRHHHWAPSAQSDP